MSSRIWRVVVLVLAVAFAVSPMFSSGFGGFNPEDFPISDAPWPAQPAGWAFSIWGVIYLALIAAAAWALFAAPEDAAWTRACPPLALSLLVGVPWVEVASRAPVVATLMMLPMAVGAVMALFRSGPALWQKVPLGLYAGWLTAAGFVGLSVVLIGHGVLSPQASALLMLALALAVAITIAMWLPKEAWAYRAAVVWALVGVIAANLDPVNPAVIAVCLGGILAMALDPGRLLRR